MADKHYKRLALLMLILTLIPGFFAVRNFLRLNRASRDIADFGSIFFSKTDELNSDEVATRFEELYRLTENERRRYMDNPGAVFYHFVDDINSRAKKRGLRIISASARGSSHERTWELSATGNPAALMAYLSDLDNEERYIAYPSLSLQDEGYRNLEISLSLQLPERPSLEPNPSSEETELIRLETPRIAPGIVATLFRPTAIPEKNKLQPRTFDVPLDVPITQNQPEITFVGRFIDASGNDVIALKDNQTGRVRRLVIGTEALGWTLVESDVSSAIIRIGNEQFIVKLESP